MRVTDVTVVPSPMQVRPGTTLRVSEPSKGWRETNEAPRSGRASVSSRSPTARLKRSPKTPLGATGTDAGTSRVATQVPPSAAGVAV